MVNNTIPNSDDSIFKFFIKNLFTLGNHSIQANNQLQVEIENIESKAVRIEKQKDKVHQVSQGIINDLNGIQYNVAEKKYGNDVAIVENLVDQVEDKIVNFDISIPVEQVPNRVSNFAVAWIIYFGKIFINVTTVGLAGVIYYQLLKKKITHLNDQSKAMTKDLAVLVEMTKNSLFAQSAAISRMIDRQWKQREVINLAMENPQNIGPKAGFFSALVLNKKMEAGDQRNENVKIKADNDKGVKLAKENIANIKKVIEQLTHEVTKCTPNEIADKRIKELNANEQNLRKTLANEKVYQETNLGPIAPLYRSKRYDANRTWLENEDAIIASEPRENDDDLRDNGEIPPGQQIEDVPATTRGDIKYDPLVSRKETFQEVLETIMEDVFEGLIDPNPNNHITFNKSNRILTDQFLENRKGLYNCIAFRLLGVTKAATGMCAGIGIEPRINNEIPLLPCHPYRVLTRDQQGNPKVLTMFKRMGHLTPALNDPDVPNGTDARSALLAFRELSDVNREHLFNLLLEPLIKDDNQKLLQTKQFMLRQNDPDVEHIKVAHKLVGDIGTVIRKRYENEFLKKKLAELANDATTIPLVKNTPSSNLNLQTWEPSFLQYLNDFHRNSSLFTNAQARIDTYKEILNLSRLPSRISRPYGSIDRLVDDSSRALYELKNYYSVISYPSIGGHGSLMTTFVSWLKGSQATNDEIVLFKKFLARQLELPRNSEYRRKLDGELWDITIDEYIGWLRDGTSLGIPDINQLGSIELDLVANLGLNIKIGEFGLGVQVEPNEQGLIVPSTRQDNYKGPNTSHYLNVGFFGRFCIFTPKLKSAIGDSFRTAEFVNASNRGN